MPIESSLPGPDASIDPDETAATAAVQSARRGRTVANLTVVSAVVSLLGILTGPIQARALGPSGRGMLAAILVPVTLAPQIAGLGLGTYVIREAARQRPIPLLIGSMGAPLAVVGAISVLASGLVADLFAGGRPVVHHYVQLGFILLPVGLLAGLLLNVAVGTERWGMLILGRLISPVTWTVGLLALYFTDSLTLSSAAVVTLIGMVLGIVPFLPLAFSGRPRVDREVVREGLPFGLKTWIGGLGALANVKLDQLLMVRLVSSSELGLYVVAVTVSTFATSVFLGAVTTVIAPRISAGDWDVAARASRATLLIMAVVATGLFLVAPILLRIVFGSDFEAATAMTRVLLVASIPYTGGFVLSTVLVYSGHPGKAARIDVLTALLTVAGLLVVLRGTGAIGAAYVSLAVYSTSFLLVLRWTSRILGRPIHDLVVPRRDDVSVLLRQARNIFTRTSAVRARARAAAS